MKKTLSFEIAFLTRQPIILFFALLPLGIALLFRFLVPFLRGILWDYLGFDLAPFYDAVFLVTLFMAPAMVGSAYGFMLLDETDQKTLGYYAVLPLGLERYILRRMSSAVIYSLLAVPACAAAFGFRFSSLSGLFDPRFLGVSALLSLEAPVYALAVSSIARNKLEGISASKLISMVAMTPLVPFFVHSGWRFVAGFLPFFWPAEAYLNGGFAPLALGFVFHAFAIWGMVKIKMRRTHVMV